MRYFKFDFPDCIRKLPRRVQFEVIAGKFGLIELSQNWNNETVRELDRLSKNPRSGFTELDSQEVIDILLPLRLIDTYQEVPSFLKQTKWKAGIFNLPYSNGVCFLNPGIVRFGGKLLLFTRRYRYKLRNFKSNFGTNDLVIFKLNDDLSPNGDLVIPDAPDRYEHEQWEDPRVISTTSWGILIGMANYVQKKNWKIRQSLCHLSTDLKEFNPMYEPTYGGNSVDIELGTEHEKNWIWFEDGMDMRCIYTLEPLSIFTISVSGEPMKDEIERSHTAKWRFGKMRGGTPPVRMENEWLIFFHSSRPWNDENNRPRRRYYMGALTMSLKPPFKILRVTENPLLIGSENDIRDLMSPLVIFPCGSIFEDAHWLVSIGVNDEQCGWIKIPNPELQTLLKPIS